MQAMQRKALQEAAAYTCIVGGIHMHSKPLQVQGEAHVFRQEGGRVCDRPLRMHTHAQAAAYTTRFNRLRTNALAVARHTVSQAALLASKGACIRAHSPSTLRAHTADCCKRVLLSHLFDFDFGDMWVLCLKRCTRKSQKTKSKR
jgi:hypothetical protein